MVSDEVVTPQKGARASAVDDALEVLSASLAQLVALLEDGGLEHYDAAGLVGFLQSFESLRNRLSLVDHRAVAEGELRGLAEALGQPSMRQVLVQLVRVSPAEASRRLLAAQVCAERVSEDGEVLAPVRPELAAAQRAGTVSAEQVHIISTSLAKVDRSGFDSADVTAGEQLLVEYAETFGTKDLRRLSDQTVEAIDPDGTVPDEELCADRRELRLRRGRDGMYVGEFRLTSALGAKLTALLEPLARPRLDSQVREDGSRLTVADERSFTQRNHDALEEICDRVLRAGDVVGMGGTPATVIITIDMDDLLQRTGYGTSSDGSLMSAAQVLELANAADVIPTVMARSGAVLDAGRTRRIASNAQTLALIARDGGCSFPACDRSPGWCERHHIVDWLSGGSTDLANLTLLCRHHHHNFASRGWTCALNADELPVWSPPPWLDQQRTPMMNGRIAARIAHRDEQRRRRPEPPGHDMKARTVAG
ncbi:MAG TPA: DUF222 domain-containing protein [Propionibacteriaceae bacterium]